MISERDFVLSNFYIPAFDKSSVKNTILKLKDSYKEICENTSDNSDLIVMSKEDFEHVVKAIEFGSSNVSPAVAIRLKDKYLKKKESEAQISTGKGEDCEICGKFVEGFEYKMCCNGRDCGCFGKPTEPCICCDKCWDWFIDDKKKANRKRD